MKIAEAIASASELTGQAVSQTAALRWLSELDGQIIFDVYGVNVWNPYTTDDLQKTLVVPYPWDGVYVHHLEAMTYFSNAEYDRYENARVMCEHVLGEFRRAVQRTKVCDKPTVQWGKSVTIKRGDSYTVPIALTSESDPIALEDVDHIDFTFASPCAEPLRKSYPGAVTWDSENTEFLFPFTSDETAAFRPGILFYDVRVFFTSGEVIGLKPIGSVTVIDALGGV